VWFDAAVNLNQAGWLHKKSKGSGDYATLLHSMGCWWPQLGNTYRAYEGLSSSLVI